MSTPYEPGQPEQPERPGDQQPGGYGPPTGAQQPPGYGPPPGYGQPGAYGAPGYGPPPGYAPWADPLAKSKLVAGLLGIFLGGFGIHRFYLGYTTIGVVQIVVTLLTCGVGAVWGLIEGILILVGSTITTDADGRPLKDS